MPKRYEKYAVLRTGLKKCCLSNGAWRSLTDQKSSREFRLEDGHHPVNSIGSAYEHFYNSGMSYGRLNISPKQRCDWTNHETRISLNRDQIGGHDGC